MLKRSEAAFVRGCSMVVLLFVSALTPALANDTIWEGLFRYQLQMAQLGNAEAQYKLAEHYEQGLGVGQDIGMAKVWYEKASAQGYAQAGEKLKSLNSSKVPAARQDDPAVAQLAREHAARLQAQQELARVQADRAQMEVELSRQRQELERLKAEKAREKAVAPAPRKEAQPVANAVVPSVKVDDKAQRQRQREEAIEKAEAEYRRAMERRIAKERLEMELLRLQSTPVGYDN